MFKDLGSKIILSLSYTDQFQYPLTREEIFLRIIGDNDSVSFKDIEEALGRLIFEKKIFFRKGFYFLEKFSNSVGVRLRRKKLSRKKWLETEEFVGLVRHIPWISGILVTGSLAVNNVKKNDDVDFLIVTQKNRLWVVRVLVVILVFFKGKKRSWRGDDSDTWCLNLWLDESSLELPKRLRNIYGAFEICQAVWIYDRGNLKSQFFKLNKWAQKFIPNYFHFQKETKSIIVSDKNKKLPIISSILDAINTVLFFLQYFYMKPHMTSEKVEKSFAFFHPRNTKRRVLIRWLRKFKKSI